MNEEKDKKNEEQQYANYFNIKKRRREFEDDKAPIKIVQKKTLYRKYRNLMKSERSDMNRLTGRLAGEKESEKYNIGYHRQNNISTDGGISLDEEDSIKQIAAETDSTTGMYKASDEGESGGEGGQGADEKGIESAGDKSKGTEESIFEVLTPEWFKGGKDIGKFTFRSIAKMGRTCLPCCAGPLAGAVLIFFTIIVIILWMLGVA